MEGTTLVVKKMNTKTLGTTPQSGEQRFIIDKGNPV